MRHFNSVFLICFALTSGTVLSCSKKIVTAGPSANVVRAASICDKQKCTDVTNILDKVTDNNSLAQNFQLFPYAQGDTSGTSIDTSGCYKPSLNQEDENYQSNKIVAGVHQVVIQADRFSKQLSKAPYACGNPNTQFASGFLNTRSHFLFSKQDPSNANSTTLLKGGVEVLAAVPYGYALWPAIWMLPQGIEDHWPAGMEIDMVEFMNKKADTTTGQPIYSPNGAELWSNTFYSAGAGNAINTGNNGYHLLLQNIKDSSQDANNRAPNPKTLHNYGFTWDCAEDRSTCDIAWYLDGEEYFHMHLDSSTDSTRSYLYDSTKQHINFVDKSQPQIALTSLLKGLDAGYYLIMNIAIGGQVLPFIVQYDDPNFVDATMDIRGIKRLVFEQQTNH